MKVEIVPLSSLVSDPSNVRLHPEKNLEAIKGSLKKFVQQADRFFCRVSVRDGCWDFKDVQRHTGYGKFHSCGVTWRAHRWILWAMGSIRRDDERCVLHSCDNRRCVNPGHLRLGDRYENAQDIKTRGRSHLIRDPKLGSLNPAAKLDEAAVNTIRLAIKSGARGKDLAASYGISKSVISEIKSRKLWGHI